MTARNKAGSKQRLLQAFANDGAFAVLSPGKLEALLTDQVRLSSLLKYHLLRGDPNFETAFGPGSGEPTLAGKTVRLTLDLLRKS